jgi:AbiU2
MSAEDDLHAKWVKWLETIRNETHTLWLYRDYQRGLSEMTQANDDIPPTTFFHALGVWYAAAQMTGVRRQLDRDQRSVSLWRLLNDIAAHPEVMTRERHMSLWFDDDDDEIDREFKTADANRNYDRFAGAGNDSIDPKLTMEDRDRLQGLGEPITAYVNKRIAHRDEKNLPAAPTYGELNAAVDELGELLKRYVSLLQAVGLPELVPVHQEDWTRAFTVAWKKH